MKILILNWRDIQNPLAGGAEISLFYHAHYWQKKGAQIIWFASSFDGAKDEEVIHKIKIVRRGSHYTVHLWAIYFLLTNRFKDVDIIVDCFHFIPFFTPLFARNKKIIAVIHEVAGKLWFANLNFFLAFVGYASEPVIIQLYKNIPFITVSNSTKNNLEKFRMKNENIFVIHNGLSIYEISGSIQKEKFPVLLFLGRIAKDKGIIDALKVFHDVSKKFPTAQFWIIGREERKNFLKKVLKKCVHDKKVLKNIVYEGFVSEKKKFELLKKSWILIHPSQKEGWGLTVIEAASQGVPTVGYNVEGLRDSIIHGETGFLTMNNTQEMTQGVVKLLSQKTLYNKMSKAAKKWSREFNWRKSEKESYRLIEKVFKQ